jgi:hypothetical protein
VGIQLKFSIGLEKVRFVESGKTVLASLAPAATNKTTKDQAATKKAEGSKPSGDTTKAEKETKKAIDNGGILGELFNKVVHAVGGAEEVVPVEQ